LWIDLSWQPLHAYCGGAFPAILILYEYPFNERIRTLLRLEDLFEKLEYFLQQPHPQAHHVVLVTLFEILDVAGRAELKSDLLQELERQRQTLTGYRNNPAIESDKLEELLAEIAQATTALINSPGKTGQHLRENDWLTSIRSRTIIPGGTCEFDLPSYYAWQNRPAQQRLKDLQGWIMPLLPLRDCFKIVLHLLRGSGQTTKIVAPQGGYQQMLAGKSYQMLQVKLDETLGAIPEISANKYMLWIRFSGQDPIDFKQKSYEGEVPFELVLCNL
jgi:cell division protein ZapD